MATDIESQLEKSLHKLETCLLAPVVPGELPEWAAAARDACAALRAPLHDAMEAEHAQAFRDILRQDAGLAQRVETMQQEDERLSAEYDKLLASLSRLWRAAEALEPDELRLQSQVDEATAAGSQLVQAVRKQEVALSTWLIEAMDRDRGDVD